LRISRPAPEPLRVKPTRQSFVLRAASPETLWTASRRASLWPPVPHRHHTEDSRNHGPRTITGTLRPADRGNHRPSTSVRGVAALLDFQSRFHHSALGTFLLIAASATRQLGWQDSTPGASSIASFAGEKAIWFSPPWSTRTSRTARRSGRPSFKFVPVFDIAQTDGEGLPSICNRLEAAIPKVATPSS